MSLSVMILRLDQIGNSLPQPLLLTGKVPDAHYSC